MKSFNSENPEWDDVVDNTTKTIKKMAYDDPGKFAVYVMVFSSSIILFVGYVIFLLFGMGKVFFQMLF